MAFRMMVAVEHLVQKVMRYFYCIMLLGNFCPHCKGQLTMVSESTCRCGGCGYTFDPTVQFQRCSACGGQLRLKIRRYQCKKCGADVQSRFLFDNLIFDRDYYQQKMVESRKRKEQKREEIRKMLAESRSDPLLLETSDLHSVPGLIETWMPRSERGIRFGSTTITCSSVPSSRAL